MIWVSALLAGGLFLVPQLRLLYPSPKEPCLYQASNNVAEGSEFGL